LYSEQEYDFYFTSMNGSLNAMFVVLQIIWMQSFKSCKCSFLSFHKGGALCPMNVVLYVPWIWCFMYHGWGWGALCPM